jgi:cyclopropane-fatty-acyl-phospholipid synthase
MPRNIIQQLADHYVHRYGSIELLKFEAQMSRYFAREYERWHGNKELPESYGVSSFEGCIARKETLAESIDHYNKELCIYQAFLDKEHMAYTMAYYGATAKHTEINNSLSLEQAQTEKYKLIIERAEIEDGQKILDLGCGFGGFLKYLLKTYPNVTVTGINPSTVQTKYIRDTLSDFDKSRFDLIERYISDVNEDVMPHNSYDRIVSIGVLEHISNLDLLFKYQAEILKAGGKAFHHCIVSIDTLPQFLNAESTLIAKYFPGGHIWPYAELRRHNTHLKFIESWFVNGMNYWKTLDEWHKRFWDSIEYLYPYYLSIDEVKDWNEYFILCKSMFLPDNGNSYGNGQFLYEKI